MSLRGATNGSEMISAGLFIFGTLKKRIHPHKSALLQGRRPDHVKPYAGYAMDRVSKDLIRIFKEFILSITIITGDFLYVTQDIKPASTGPT